MTTAPQQNGRLQLDPIRELRLRRWAREHYVRPEERNSGWHPIVLDEMATRDEELTAASHASRFVPLAPSTHFEVHAGHGAVAGPKFARQTVRVSAASASELPEWGIVEEN